jgi:hypothetical protein
MFMRIFPVGLATTRILQDQRSAKTNVASGEDFAATTLVTEKGGVQRMAPMEFDRSGPLSP